MVAVRSTVPAICPSKAPLFDPLRQQAVGMAVVWGGTETQPGVEGEGTKAREAFIDIPHTLSVLFLGFWVQLVPALCGGFYGVSWVGGLINLWGLLAQDTTGWGG